MPDDLKIAYTKTGLLLHSCCGPCSTAVIERLDKDYAITVFFFNPCITDPEEYEKRKAVQKQYLDSINKGRADENRIGFIEGDYNKSEFYREVKGLENKPEGGARCAVCFRQRLGATARLAKKEGLSWFGTTLSVSPHKNFSLIQKIGNELADETETNFLGEDFKKQAGYARSVELSKEHGLYRQNYCGCEFSKNRIQPGDVDSCKET